MQDLADFIGAVGFPAATASVLLWWLIKRLNGKLDRLTDAVVANTVVASDLSGVYQKVLVNKIDTFSTSAEKLADTYRQALDHEKMLLNHCPLVRRPDEVA